MRSRHPLSIALLLLLSAFLYTVPAARAADDTYDDEYEEHARVLRVSLLKGEVSLKRAGENEWENARLNTPLVEGDLLATGRDSRLEIQVDARNFIRVGPDSVLKVVTLREEGIALSLSEGTATFRLSRFENKKEYFEIDAPKTTVAAEKTGQYRIDVDRGGGVSVTVREDGRARIYSQSSGFVLRNNRTARLAYDGSDEGDWEVGAAARFDEWDNWNDERERYLAARLRYDGRDRYYDTDVYGAEELDLYGDWVYTRDYGYVWRPHVTVINNYNNWAPYRYGHWDWCPPYGWTWIPDEDWGWAPYHYGRWVYFNNEWCWAPRGYGYRYRRAWWRPALVAFVTLDFGNDRRVCWYPLTYGQRDPRGRLWSRRYDPVTPLRRGEVDNLRRNNPALLRAVTSVPARDFGGAGQRARAAAGDLAQRTLASEPIRGQLPVTRSDSTRAPRVGVGEGGGREGRTRATGANGRDVLTIVRPAPVVPPRAVPDRPTGAAARTPGVPLDDELRRTRILNNREPRVPPSSTAGGDSQSRDAGAGNGTGAVERTRTPGVPTSNSGEGGEAVAPVRVRPARPTPPVDAAPGYPTQSDEPRPRRREPDAGDDSGAPRARPTRPPVERNGDDSTREARPTPPLVNRSEPRVRQRDDERPSMPPARREEPPTSRPEPSEPRESRPPRSEPPRQEAPRQEAPRQESPRQEAPRQEAPRQEAPRQEAPRQEAPRQEAPRQESPRQESPRQESPREPRTERPPRPRR